MILFISTAVLSLNTRYTYGIDTVINVVFAKDLPPYQFVENGEPKGLHVDLLNKIAENRSLIIHYMPKNTLSECFDTLISTQADIVLGSYTNYENWPDIKYTNDISQSDICMFAHSEQALRIKKSMETKHYQVSIQEGTMNQEYVRKMQNIEYQVMSNQIRVFYALESEQVELAIGVKHSLIYQMNEEGLEDDYSIINNFMGNMKYNMAVRAENLELLNQLNQAIADLRLSGEYEKLYNKWIDEHQYEMKKWIDEAVKVIGFILIAAGVIFTFNLRLNHLLKKQVARKTIDLQILNDSLKLQIEETRNNAELNSKIVENNPMGIIVVNRNGVITRKNQNAQKYAAEESDILGRSMMQIPLFSKILGDKEKDVSQAKMDIWNEIAVMKENHGLKERYYRYSIYHLFHNDGSNRGMILLLDDITTDYEIRDRMYEMEKNKALNQFIAEIAHEIRNPLTAIKTLVELIPYKRDNADFQDKLTQIVPDELDRINTLIKTLIDYAKPKLGVKGQVIINETIKNCISLINSTIGQDEIRIIYKEQGPISIEAVENQIKQIIINILLNAIEAIKEKLKNEFEREPLCIEVSVESNENFAVLTFYDEGVGMTPDEMKRCTEIFYTTKNTGTGTGLAVCLQYVKENNGEIYFDSSKGNYTKIMLTFPISERRGK